MPNAAFLTSPLLLAGREAIIMICDKLAYSIYKGGARYGPDSELFG